LDFLILVSGFFDEFSRGRFLHFLIFCFLVGNLRLVKFYLCDWPEHAYFWLVAGTGKPVGWITALFWKVF
jgi:hypothetical protein